MCNSWALDLITLSGTAELDRHQRMLFPAAAIERSRLSSSSVHKRQLRLVMARHLQANETGPGVSFTVTGVAHSSGPRSTDDIQRWVFKAEPQAFLNIFTCILQLLQPAGRSANPVQTSHPRGPRFTALSGFFFPSLGLKPSARISASSWRRRAVPTL